MQKFIIVTHQHRHGTDTFPCRIEPNQKVDTDTLVKRFNIDYEPERGEEIDWNEYNFDEIPKL